MEVINWVEDEEKGNWSRPNLVTYVLLETMSNHKQGEEITETFKPFNPKALEVEFKINGIDVSFTEAMNKIQQAIADLEEDIKKNIIKDAANELINHLQNKVEGWD